MSRGAGHRNALPGPPPLPAAPRGAGRPTALLLCGVVAIGPFVPATTVISLLPSMRGRRPAPVRKPHWPMARVRSLRRRHAPHHSDSHLITICRTAGTLLIGHVIRRV